MRWLALGLILMGGCSKVDDLKLQNAHAQVAALNSNPTWQLCLRWMNRPPDSVLPKKEEDFAEKYCVDFMKAHAGRMETALANEKNAEFRVAERRALQ